VVMGLEVVAVVPQGAEELAEAGKAKTTAYY